MKKKATKKATKQVAKKATKKATKQATKKVAKNATTKAKGSRGTARREAPARQASPPVPLSKPEYRIPDRYAVESNTDTGTVIISDTKTGNSTAIDMSLYGALSNALAELLPDETSPVPMTQPAAMKSSAEQTGVKSAVTKKAVPPRRTAKSTSRKPRRLPPPKAEPPKAAPKEPPSWVVDHPERIEEREFTLRRLQVPKTPYWGFEIIVGRKRQAFVIAEEERRWVLRDARNDRFEPSVHRNLIGAIARLSASIVPKILSKQAA